MQSDGDFLRGVRGRKREIMSKEKLIINTVVYMYMYNVVVHVGNLYA